MSVPGAHPNCSTPHRRWWLILGAVVLPVLGAYASINHGVLGQSMAALLTVYALVLVGAVLVSRRQLRLALAQRDEALVQVTSTQWPTSEALCHLESSAADCAQRRLEALQVEVAELRGRERLLQVQAHHDGLTGLANRWLLTDRFRLAVERAKRSGMSFALLMVDLNGFKSINDHHGHAAGDEVLVVTAQRLMGSVRASDTVARIGGDEFVLLIESIEDPQEMLPIGEKLFDTLTDPMTLNAGVVAQLGASIGIAFYPDDGLKLKDLLHVADQAMYECKSTGLMSLQ